MKEPADWSNLPRDIYVTRPRLIDGIVWEIECCSVPMMTVPEVRYTLAQSPEPKPEHRQTFTVSEGFRAVLDKDGRATGEIEPEPKPEPDYYELTEHGPDVPQSPEPKP